MKTKDIMTLVVCVVMIAGSVFFIFKMNAKSKPKPVESTQSSEPEFTGDLDKYNKLLESVETHTDYGTPALENIGREDPFAAIN